MRGMFDMVGLHININNMMRIFFQPRSMDVSHSEADYERRMIGVGLSCWEQKQDQVCCLECTADLAVGSLEAHLQDQDETGQAPQREATLQPPEPRIYMVSFPRAASYIGFPVEACKGWMKMHTKLQIHFVHHHMWDAIVIMEEGNFLHP